LKKDIPAGVFGEKSEVTREERKRNGEKKERNKGHKRWENKARRSTMTTVLESVVWKEEEEEKSN